MMELNYHYEIKGNNNATLESLIIQDDKVDNYISIFKDNRRNGSYLVKVAKPDQLRKCYYIPENYLNDIPIDALLNYPKDHPPIILNSESNCDYISKDEDGSSFIIDCYGKMLKMEFTNDKILAYFREINMLYTYGFSYNDNTFNSFNNVGIYNNYLEKYNIQKDFGLLNDFGLNNGDRSGMFIPLTKIDTLDSTVKNIQFQDYNVQPLNGYTVYKYNIDPYYLSNYTKYKFNDNNLIDMPKILDDGKEYKIFYDRLVPQFSFRNNRYCKVSSTRTNNILTIKIKVYDL